MADSSETLRGILSQIARIEREIAEAQLCQTRRSSFEDLCSRYTALAKNAGEVLGVSFPSREVRSVDFGMSVGIVRPEAIRDLAG